MLGTPGSDDFDRNRAMRQLMEQMRATREALGFGDEIQRLQRQYEEIKALTSQKAERDAFDASAQIRRQLQMEFDAKRAASEMRAASMEEIIRRRQEIIDSITSIPRNEIQEMLVASANQHRSLESVASVAKVVEDLNHFHWLRLRREIEGSYRQVEEVQRAILAAATFALANAQSWQVADIEPAYLASAFTNALKVTKAPAYNGKSDKLLTFVVRLTWTISARLPGVEPSWILQWLVFPLMMVLVQAGLDEVSSRASTESIVSAVRHAAEPKHYKAIATLKVREIPTKVGKLRGTLPIGSEVEELDRDERGWRYIRSVATPGAMEGWVYYRNLRPR